MINSYEMANLTRQKSGQPFDIWIDSLGKSRNTKHSEPRLKATNNGVTIIAGFKNGEYSNFQTAKDKIRQFGSNKELEEYLNIMKPAIELHWEGLIDDGDFINIAFLVKKGYNIFDAIEKILEIIK